MSSDDFYKPPESSVDESERSMNAHADEFDVMDGDILSTSPLLLPNDVCVGCGSCEPSGKTYGKTLYYSPWWVGLLFLINIIILLIVYLILRKKLAVHYHLCQSCIQERRKRIIYAFVACLASMGGIAIGTTTDSGLLLLGALVGLFVSLVALVFVANPPIRAKKHSGGLFTVKGASPEFLDEVERRRQAARGSW